MKKITLMMAMLLLGSLGFAQVNLNSGLIAYYPFNNNLQGNIAGVASGGTPYGTMSYSTDRFGNSSSALNIDQGYFECNDSFYHDSSLPFTVVYWFKNTDTTSFIINWYAYTPLPSFPSASIFARMNSYDTYCDSSDCVGIKYTESDPSVSCSKTTALDTTIAPWFDNNWHMFVIVRKTDSLFMSIDNQLISSDSISASCTTAASLQWLHVGRNFGQQMRGGYIDDLMIYRRAINQLEQDSLYNLSASYGVTTGVEKLVNSNQLLVQLYPNPSTSSAQLIFPTMDAYQVQITDLTGRQVFQKQVVNSQNLEIQTATWPAGIYMVQVRDEKGGMTVQKLVKE